MCSERAPDTVCHVVALLQCSLHRPSDWPREEYSMRHCIKRSLAHRSRRPGCPRFGNSQDHARIRPGQRDEQQKQAQKKKDCCPRRKTAGEESAQQHPAAGQAQAPDCASSATKEPSATPSHPTAAEPSGPGATQRFRSRGAGIILQQRQRTVAHGQRLNVKRPMHRVCSSTPAGAPNGAARHQQRYADGLRRQAAGPQRGRP